MSAAKKQSEDVMQRLSPNQNCGLGMASGVLCKMVNYPLLVWKNASQQGRPISLNPSLVYRGLPMACVNLGGTTAAQFYFTGTVSYTHLRAHETPEHLVCRLLLEKKKLRTDSLCADVPCVGTIRPHIHITEPTRSENISQDDSC
eukprot:TRINITY_DN52838_c0_g1_i1.p1 TRINITY_DN52838_c0_g1~~TRINITY_DN52838_c0_g1_i1.p1  ORF type:complete len:145 (-),score=25.31 TRINITY_DN52838_c0_g1_i1:8-442(-)